MGRSCAVLTCPRTSEDAVSFHRLPEKGVLRTKWIRFLKVANAEFLWTDVGKLLVCSDHFEEEHILKRCPTRISLKQTAYPRLFNGNPVISTDELVQLEVEYEAEITFSVSHSPIEDPDCLVSDKEQIVRLQSELDSTMAENSRLQTKLIQKQDQLDQIREEVRILKQKIKRHEGQQSRKRSLSPMPTAAKKPCTELVPLKEGSIASHIVSRITKNYVNAPYTEELKDFSYQLHYYSPRAYKFLRENLEVLPHPRTFNRWTENIDSSPGFLSHSISLLKKLHSESQHKIYYNLAFDEIHIRQQIIHDGDGFTGYTDYGGILKNDEKPKEATCALFFMATAINASHRVPLGYILSNGLKAEVLAEVIKKSILVINETNGRVLSVTFDGLRSNLLAMQLLGANLDVTSEHFKCYFMDPTTNQKVYIILDVCHMMKLLRNLFKEYGILSNATEGKIKWVFIDRLEKLQRKSGLKAANKLSAMHTNFAQQKMKTKLSVQTFSNSVSVALGVCRQLKVEGFTDTEDTEQFLSLINKLFDILNSRVGGKFGKSPINERNFREILDFFASMKTYLLALSVNENGQRKLLINAQKSTAVRGLVVTISSLTMIIGNVLGQCELKYLPTYKLSQDKIELFFSVLRSRFGFNDNPNVVQLRQALKGILCINAKTVNTGNCYAENDVLQKVCPFGKLANIIEDGEDLSCTTEEIEVSEESHEPFEELSAFVGNIVMYISGWVGRALCSSLPCPACICRLFPDDGEAEELSKDAVLLLSKDKGGLFFPSVFLLSVCKLAEQVIRQNNNVPLSSIRKENLLKILAEEFARQENYPKLKPAEGECPLNHTMNLVQAIGSEYMKIRLHHIARQSTLELKATNNRSVCTKLVHFAGN